jgi:hypothetical protein
MPVSSDGEDKDFVAGEMRCTGLSRPDPNAGPDSELDLDLRSLPIGDENRECSGELRGGDDIIACSVGTPPVSICRLRIEVMT